MEVLWVLVALLILFVLAGALDFVQKEGRIEEPTRIILRKIENGDFTVSSNYCDDEYRVVTENGKTEYTEWKMLNSWSVKGEFAWMNPTEVERVGRAIKKITDEREKKYHEACKLEKAARDAQARALAKEMYKE